MDKIAELTMKRNEAWVKSNDAYRTFKRTGLPADRKAWIIADADYHTYAELLELNQRKAEGKTGTQQCTNGIHSYTTDSMYDMQGHCIRCGKLEE